MDVHGHSHGGIVACAAATPTVNLRKLVVYEGWPVLDPSIYALSADVVERMDKLLAAGDQDGGVPNAAAIPLSAVNRIGFK